MGQEQMMGQEQVPMQVPMQVSQVPQVFQGPSPQQGGIEFPRGPITFQHPMENTEMYDSGTGSGPFIAIRTDDEAMAADGLLSGFSRAPRRAPYRNMGMMQSPMQASMQPAMQRFTPSGSPSDVVRVTKLE